MSWRIEGRYFENCIFHPASTERSLGRARSSRVNAFGMEFSNDPGTSGFSTHFLPGRLTRGLT